MDKKILPKMSIIEAAEKLGITLQGVHQYLKYTGHSCPKIGIKSYIDHTVGKYLFNLVFNKKKFAVQIVKGGTGKTSILHNVACAASIYGARVLVVDLDPQGNLTDAFNVDAEETPVLIDVLEKKATIQDCVVNVADGIDLIPSRIENVVLDSKLVLSKSPLHNVFSEVLEEIENAYDFIFLDCPPMIGHSVAAATLYVDEVLIPLNPDKFSMKGLQILKNEIKNLSKQYKKELKYKVFLNKFSGNTILSDKAIQTTISNEADAGNALSTAVRLSQDIPNATDRGESIFSSLKQSSTRQDLDLLTREILGIEIQERQMQRGPKKGLNN